jgi:hypothetical protein
MDRAAIRRAADELANLHRGANFQRVGNYKHANNLSIRGNRCDG